MNEKKNSGHLALWVIAGLSLAVNIALIIILLWVQQKISKLQTETVTFLTTLSSEMGDINDGTFEYMVNIDQELPIKGEIPINFTVDVPIKTILPVDTTVIVPVSVFGTSRNISIPIRTDIPIDITVQVPIEQVVPIDMTVPVKLAVPIRITVADTPLSQSITDLQAALERMALGIGDGSVLVP